MTREDVKADISEASNATAGVVLQNRLLVILIHVLVDIAEALKK